MKQNGIGIGIWQWWAGATSGIIHEAYYRSSFFVVVHVFSMTLNRSYRSHKSNKEWLRPRVSGEWVKWVAVTIKV